MSSSAHLATEHFFRHEHGRLVAALVAQFGTWRLQLVEDAVQEALVRALQTPRNPVGWFEIHVNDMARAKAFYESVFQVKLEQLATPAMGVWKCGCFPAAAPRVMAAPERFAGWRVARLARAARSSTFPARIAPWKRAA